MAGKSYPSSTGYFSSDMLAILNKGEKKTAKKATTKKAPAKKSTAKKK